MAWQQKLKASGIDDSNMPNMIKKAIKDLKILENRIGQIDDTLEKGEISDIRKGELEEERDTIIESIEAQEEVISDKIDKWNRNKDMYLAKGEKMKSALAQKRNGQTKETKENKETTQTQQAPPPPQPPAEAIEVEAEEIKPTKSSGIGKIGLFILLGVLSFGAYNYLKNND